MKLYSLQRRVFLDAISTLFWPFFRGTGSPAQVHVARRHSWTYTSSSARDCGNVIIGKMQAKARRPPALPRRCSSPRRTRTRRQHSEDDRTSQTDRAPSQERHPRPPFPWSGSQPIDPPLFSATTPSPASPCAYCTSPYTHSRSPPRASSGTAPISQQRRGEFLTVMRLHRVPLTRVVCPPPVPRTTSSRVI